MITLDTPILPYLRTGVSGVPGARSWGHALKATTVPTDQTALAGVWDIFGGPEDYSSNTWVNGHIIGLRWNQVEATEGVFTWNLLDSRIASVVNQGLKWGLLLTHGNVVPSWIYGYVAKTVTSAAEYPDYLDPVYATKLFTMIDALVTHIQTLSDAQQAALGAIQCPVGKSGDKQGYAGTYTSGPWYEPDSREWQWWTRYALERYKESLAPLDCPLIINYGDGAECYQWSYGYATELERLDNVLTLVNDDRTKAVIKYPRPGHRFDVPREVLPTEFWFNEIVARGITTREEFDAYTGGVYSVAAEYLTNLYWNMLWCLTTKLTQWNIQPDKWTAQEQSDYAFIFEFFNKYAGFAAADSPGCFIALRDSLDAADTVRFTEASYGAYSETVNGDAQNNAGNITRFSNILSDFTSFGAAQDDTTNQFDGWVTNETSVTGHNDVKFAQYTSGQRQIAQYSTFTGSGNYELYMTMIDPVNTSQGVWRTGDQGDKAHRFARQFNGSNDAMRFQLDTDFVASLTEEITITVTYYDSGTGSWQLVYDAAGDSAKAAITVTNTNTDTWLEATATVSDYVFGRNGPGTGGSDVGIEHVAGANTIFHLIELERGGAIAPSGGAGSSKRRARRRARYPRRVYIDGRSYWVRSADEERRLLEAHRAMLEAERQAVEPTEPARAKALRVRIRRVERRIEATDDREAQWRAYLDAEDEELIALLH